jgi:hypothetical protein
VKVKQRKEIHKEHTSWWNALRGSSHLITDIFVRVCGYGHAAGLFHAVEADRSSDSTERKVLSRLGDTNIPAYEVVHHPTPERTVGTFEVQPLNKAAVAQCQKSLKIEFTDEEMTDFMMLTLDDHYRSHSFYQEEDFEPWSERMAENEGKRFFEEDSYRTQPILLHEPVGDADITESGGLSKLDRATYGNQSFIDIDALQYCRRCCEPLAMYEESREQITGKKMITILERLSRNTGSIPIICLEPVSVKDAESKELSELVDNEGDESEIIAMGKRNQSDMKTKDKTIHRFLLQVTTIAPFKKGDVKEYTLEETKQFIAQIETEHENICTGTEPKSKTPLK